MKISGKTSHMCDENWHSKFALMGSISIVHIHNYIKNQSKFIKHPENVETEMQIRTLLKLI